MKHVLVLLAALAVGGCSWFSSDPPPETTTVKAKNYTDAWAQAQAHCKKSGKSASINKVDDVKDGGDSSYTFDCLEPPQ